MRCPSAKCVKAVFKTQLEVCTYNMLWYMNPDGSRTQTPHVMLYEILETWKSDSVLCLTSSLYSTIGFSELKIIRPAKSILCLSFACFLEKSTCSCHPLSSLRVSLDFNVEVEMTSLLPFYQHPFKVLSTGGSHTQGLYPSCASI